jgi:hypothetical protein
MVSSTKNAFVVFLPGLGALRGESLRQIKARLAWLLANRPPSLPWRDADSSPGPKAPTRRRRRQKRRLTLPEAGLAALLACFLERLLCESKGKAMALYVPMVEAVLIVVLFGLLSAALIVVRR